MRKTCVTLTILVCFQVCACGPMQPRIKGGVDAPEKEWPWIVSLHDPKGHFCGGSLISSEWVLSAAHCFTGISKDKLHVYLGKLTQREENKNEIVRDVQEIYNHKLFNAATGDNDIALLHLSAEVEFNDYIRPLCLLATGSDFPTGTLSTIIGWGRTAPEVKLANPGRLQQAEVVMQDHTLCSKQLTQLIKSGTTTKMRFTDNMICASSSSSGEKCLKGDSGGPMMSQHCSQWVQSGISSWGAACDPTLAGVYTRVSMYEQWITDTITNAKSKALPRFVDLRKPCEDSEKKKKSWWCCCLG